MRQRDRAFVFVHRHALDQSLIVEVPQLGRLAAAGISKIAFRNDPKRTDRRQGPRFGSIQGVVAVAIAHRFAVVTMRQFDVPHERITRIGRSIIMPFSGIAIALVARRDVAATAIVAAILGEPATATSSERH